MKVCTITCHDVYNQGASLQALALATYLDKIGCETKIIDYKPEYSNTYYNLGKVANPRFERPFVKQAYLLAKMPRRLVSIFFRAKPFDRFKNRYLPLTKHYTTLEQLKADPPQADVYIAGSDQIWNTFLPNGKDGAFFLEFAPEESRKISYAASFATETVDAPYLDFVKDSLKRFDAVSLREASSLPLLESLGRKDGVAVCDPVFLLPKEEWLEFIAEENHPVSGYRNLKKFLEEKYLLVYEAEKSANLDNIAKSVARERGLRIFSVSNIATPYADKSFWHASPLDFVRLIAKADYVVSNSFHATAFSLIFHRDFCVVGRQDKSNSRMLSLLEDMNVSDKYASFFSADLCRRTDFSMTDTKLQKKREESSSYLISNIYADRKILEKG